MDAQGSYTLRSLQGFRIYSERLYSAKFTTCTSGAGGRPTQCKHGTLLPFSLCWPHAVETPNIVVGVTVHHTGSPTCPRCYFTLIPWTALPQGVSQGFQFHWKNENDPNIRDNLLQLQSNLCHIAGGLRKSLNLNRKTGRKCCWTVEVLRLCPAGLVSHQWRLT